MVSAVNSLNSHRPQLPHPQMKAASGEVRRVWDRFHRDVLARGRESIQGRRAFGQSGVHPLASLLHQTVDGYTVRPRKIAQVPLVADLLDEPSTSSCVDMLEALPEEDSLFYASEDAVVSWEGKCTQTFTEIEERFGFLGGAPEEWIR